MNNEKIISDLHDEFVRDKQMEENDWDSQEELLEFGKFCYQEAQKQKDEEIQENNCAWCPDCGDLLKIKQFKLNPNENWIYYCEGCDKEFEIVGRSLKQQLSDVNKIIDDKFILDVTASKRTFWINKEHPNTIFLDNREEVKPEVIGDFRKLEFQDNSFNLIIFDPPHILQKDFNKNLVTHQYYGVLNPETWKEDLKKGFDECFRVLKERGTLIFKWSDCNRWANSKAKLKDIFKFINYEPLIIERFKLSENSTTYWCVFTKITSLAKGDVHSQQTKPFEEDSYCNKNGQEEISLMDGKKDKTAEPLDKADEQQGRNSASAPKDNDICKICKKINPIRAIRGCGKYMGYRHLSGEKAICGDDVGTHIIYCNKCKKKFCECQKFVASKGERSKE